MSHVIANVMTAAGVGDVPEGINEISSIYDYYLNIWINLIGTQKIDWEIAEKLIVKLGQYSLIWS